MSALRRRAIQCVSLWWQLSSERFSCALAVAWRLICRLFSPIPSDAGSWLFAFAVAIFKTPESPTASDTVGSTAEVRCRLSQCPLLETSGHTLIKNRMNRATVGHSPENAGLRLRRALRAYLLLNPNHRQAREGLLRQPSQNNSVIAIDNVPLSPAESSAHWYR